MARLRNLMPILVSALWAGCSTPTAPANQEDPAGLARITVTSPIGTRIAVGRSVQLSAETTDGAGAPVAVTLSWASSDESLATVDSQGLVVVQGEGSITVSASAGDVSGQLSLALDAVDLDSAAELLGDAYLATLEDALASGVPVAMDRCRDAVEVGHLMDVEACVDEARASLAGVDPADAPTAAALDLFLLRLAELLNL